MHQLTREEVERRLQYLEERTDHLLRLVQVIRWAQMNRRNCQLCGEFLLSGNMNGVCDKCAKAWSSTVLNPKGYEAEDV